MDIVREWLEDLRAALSDELLVIDARVGVFYTAIQLSAGDAGVAFTPRDLSDTVCCPKTAAGAPPAGQLIGRKAWELAEWALVPSPLRRALGVATLNALSAVALNRYGPFQGELRVGLDALDATEIVVSDRVVMVGALVPFIKAVKRVGAQIRIIDKHPNALKPEERPLWVPPERAAEALGSADVAIITGSALVEGGIDELLGWAAGARIRVIAGPTAPLWPAPFFIHGVDILGGIQVRDAATLLTIVGQGGSGYLFARAAEKVCVLNRAAPALAERFARSA